MKPNFKHGMYKSAAYKRWMNMKHRCKRDLLYVQQGINVCERWRDFANFYEDMGDPPEGKTLDRIDGTKGYSPDNCRWATPTEQGRNLRTNVRVNGLTISEIAEKTGMSHNAISYRVKQGLDVHAPPINQRKFCKKGHEWTEENTYIGKTKYKDGYREQRYCRKCRAEYQAKRRN